MSFLILATCDSQSCLQLDEISQVAPCIAS